MLLDRVEQNPLSITVQCRVRKIGNGFEIVHVGPDLGIEFAEIGGIVPVCDDPGAGEMEEEAWSLAAEEAGDEGIQGGLVVGAAVV